MAWVQRSIEPATLSEQEALLAPAVEILTPEEGDGPFPVVLQFHGCAGPRMDFLRGWASVANEAGYAAMIVDSTGARGMDYEDAMAQVCEGKTLLGIERTRDITAAISLAKQDSRLDTDEIVLAGWSHGGWTVMDFLTLDFEKRTPPKFDLEGFVIPEIKGTIVFYPHCGLGSLSRFRQWRQTPDMLAFIAEKDSIVDAQQCISMLEKRQQRHEIDLVQYPDAEHIFDDVTLLEEYPQYYDEAAATDSIQRFRAFLADLHPAQ